MPSARCRPTRVRHTHATSHDRQDDWRCAFDQGPLNHLLRNRMYLGEINHRGKSYPGEHAAIVGAGLFNRVLVKLTEHRHSFLLKHQRSEALLLRNYSTIAATA